MNWNLLEILEQQEKWKLLLAEFPVSSAAKNKGVKVVSVLSNWHNQVRFLSSDISGLLRCAVRAFVFMELYVLLIVYRRFVTAY